MGYTRVIYSDATTAEAISILKTCGFVESSQGGLFTSPSIPLKIYVVWGKSSYYPDIFSQLDFAPRIQIHLKSRENCAELTEVTLCAANGLRVNSPGTRICVYDADTKQKVNG